VHEILRYLPSDARVLDLGSGAGTFEAADCPQAVVVRVDCEMSPRNGNGRPHFVQADAAQLPFRDGTFHAVVANHCLEHVENLDYALREVGRIIRRDGSLYVAVPDATTLSDRLYRWVYHGGGHINSFIVPRTSVIV
jgi:ubiquinone/menaquinone biosynthesis C-methylase UbiE